jgi:hypothetical protein
MADSMKETRTRQSAEKTRTEKTPETRSIDTLSPEDLNISIELASAPQPQLTPKDVVALQRTIGNQAVVDLDIPTVQRSSGAIIQRALNPIQVMRLQISQEDLNRLKPEDLAKVEQLMTENKLAEARTFAQNAYMTLVKTKLKNDYGIDLDNQAGVDAMTALYQSFAPGKTMPALTKKVWSFEETKWLERALKNYGPLLKAKKDDPNRPLKSFSRLETGVDIGSSGDIALDTATAGETFTQTVGSNKLSNISMYDQASKGTDFVGKDKNFRGTIEHELSHAFIEGLAAPSGAGKAKWDNTRNITTMIEHFANVLDFWDDVETKSGDASAEAPVTGYGQKNAREDLAEAMMFFFESPKKLKDDCPIRFQFIWDNIRASLDPETVRQVSAAISSH